jgi:hypothetical protein
VPQASVHRGELTNVARSRELSRTSNLALYKFESTSSYPHPLEPSLFPACPLLGKVPRFFFHPRPGRDLTYTNSCKKTTTPIFHATLQNL